MKDNWIKDTGTLYHFLQLHMNYLKMKSLIKKKQDDASWDQEMQ